MPIQHLFSRHDSRVYPNVTKEAMVERISEFLREAQFYISFYSPFQLHAEQYYQKLGLRRVMDIWVSDVSGGTSVTIEFSASLGETETAVGLVGAVIFWPIAVAVGAVSYLDYESDANAMIQSFWAYLSSVPTGQEKAQKRCGNCGLALDEDAKFCKHCGAQVPA